MDAAPSLNALGRKQARVLAEALPYIHAYHGKTFVIDYERSIAGRPVAWNSMGRDLALLSLIGLRLIVVHRGGALNPELVSLINRHGGRAVGLTGVDGGFLKLGAAPMREHCPAGIEITGVDATLLQMHFARGFLPVIRPLASAPDGQVCPVDGGQVAAAIAAHLRASKLIIMRDSAGLEDAEGHVVHRLSAAEAEALGADHSNANFVRALRSGVGAVHVVDARRPDVLLLEVLTCESRGTLVLPDGIAGVVARSAQYLSPDERGDERESC